MGEREELLLYMEILRRINEYIKQLRYYADIEEEASKEGHSWNAEQMSAVKGRIKAKRRIADELEDIVQHTKNS